MWIKRVLTTAVIALLLINQACAQQLTSEEVKELAKYVQELEAENASLKKQVNILSGGLDKMSDTAIKVDMQTQALIARYEHSIGVMEKMSQRYEQSIVRADTVIDRLERRVNNLEGQRTLWQVLGIAGIAVGVAASR